MTQPADELRTAADKLRSLSSAVPRDLWGDRPWHVEQCSEQATAECPCIVTQGEYKPFDQPQVPAIQYVADAETPEHAAYIAAMHPGVGVALAELLDRQGRVAAEVQQFLGDEFQDGALDQDVHDALAVARAFNRTAR
jgi:hypothetical protein